MGPFKIK